MYCVKVPNGINNICTLFYRICLWYSEDESTLRETRVKLFYPIYHLLFPISLMAGAITSDNKDESIYLAEFSIAVAVLSMKLLYVIWNKKQILEILTCIGVYSVENCKEFTLVNDKLKKFMKFVGVLMVIMCVSGYFSVLVPIFRSDKKFFLKNGFHLDWKNNKIAFWIATAFYFTESNLCIVAILFSVLIWYVMVSCALRYEILGSQIRDMGVIRTSEATVKKRKVSEGERHNLFLRHLIEAIDFHQDTRGY